MAESVISSYFPSQAVSDGEKNSLDYGQRVGKAIVHEWFSSIDGASRYKSNQNTFHELRLYARGEQSVKKYKDEFAVNGDLSYTNLDWKVVPIIPKFVDIVVNGISERVFDVKVQSQDPYGVQKRTKYMESIIRDMMTKEINDMVEENFGFQMYENNPDTLPGSQEELDLHMQLNYKQAVEIAEEQALAVMMKSNKYDLISKRCVYDLTTLGIAAAKDRYSKAEGVKVEYVDPANTVWSYTEDPYFSDIYYVGEVKSIPLNELRKQFPHLTDSQVESIVKSKGEERFPYGANANTHNETDNNIVQVLYFCYKTYNKEVYKIKKTASGADKAIKKDDRFNPSQDMTDRFIKNERTIEVLYEGAMVIDTNIMLKWDLAKNMVRPKSDETKVNMPYHIVAPRMYKGRIESLVSRITGFADMIQLTHLKLQQVMSRMVPDGIYLDVDGLAEVDLGNGTNYNPSEALNMFLQTGSVLGRSTTGEGEFNHGKIPIQEITSGAGGNKVQTLIANYNYYLQMIRDATGLNEARDGSTPDSRALVGVQKLAAANSNTATRHILDANVAITRLLAENLSLRISDILEYSPSKQTFIQKIGAHNVATLEELKFLYLHDFAIFIELAPDEEEKAILENNIQTALSAGLIDLDDAIDIRDVKNVKLANQLLKIKRRKKLERDQLMQQQNIQAQAQANAQQQQVSAQLEVQKQQALTASQAQIEELKAQLEIQKLESEKAAKEYLMRLEFEMNMQLKGLEVEAAKNKDTYKEDRKDDRVKLQAEEQRKTKSGQQSFESSGNDVMTGGFDLGSFEPK